MRRVLALLLLAPSMAWGQTVLWCSSGVAAAGSPESACASPATIEWQFTAAWTWVLTPDQGWQRRADIATPTAYPFVAPPPPVVVVPPPAPAAPITDKPMCFPSLAAPRGKLLALPAGLSTQYSLGGIWSCQSPTQLRTYWRVFGFDDLLPWATGEKSDPNAEFAANPGTVTPAGVLATYMDAQMATHGWKVVVAVNGTSTTRPVYPKLASGLRGTTVVPNARVSVDAACRWWRLADSAGKATAYHSAQGLPNVATADPADKLGDVYVLCKVTAPSTGSVN